MSLLMKTPLFCCCLLLAGLSGLSAETTLLSYWSFNNAPSPEPLILKGWETTPSSFGETYLDGEKHLQSNTAQGAVFSDENIYIDFSALRGKYQGSIPVGWGVFMGTKINQLPGDDGGSFMAGPITNGSHITLVLSSRGYKSLVLSAALRTTESATIIWSWSTDGENFADFASNKEIYPFQLVTYDLSGPGGLGLTQLDDQQKLYLRATFQFPGKPPGSVALDNIQFTGESLAR